MSLFPTVPIVLWWIALMDPKITRKESFSQHWLCLLEGLYIATGGKEKTLKLLSLKNLQKYTINRLFWSRSQFIGENGKMKLLEELLFVFYHQECSHKSAISGSLRAECTGLVLKWLPCRLALWMELSNLVSVQQRKWLEDLRESKLNRWLMRVGRSWSLITS